MKAPWVDLGIVFIMIFLWIATAVNVAQTGIATYSDVFITALVTLIIGVVFFNSENGDFGL